MGKGHQGKVAVITGAASGLGEAFAMRLAEDGTQIVAVDLKPADKAVAHAKSLGREAIAIRCDITDPQQVGAMAQQVNDKFGRCDILVNNAGVYPVKFFHEMTFEDWRRVMAVNLDSIFLITKAFIAGMQDRRWGRIVNLASNTFGLTVEALVHYVASKGGVIGFTRALATEMGSYGITVNAIGPSLTRTPGTMSFNKLPGEMTSQQFYELIANMQAIKRIEEPSDLVGAVSFLTSDDAAFITGQTLYVDGGLVRGA
ncbi:MAG: 3-oxoacyl-ACP reductase FabG [Candidatus Binataceae bacterium]|nr:3-oxoacyl-ACP reductase FabG [Candidatus Binataceae bacterium]